MIRFLTWENVLGLISVATAFFGAFAWYSASVVKRYAAQRDFEHLRRNMEQLAINQAAILKEVDERSDGLEIELRELKIYLLSKMGDTTIGNARREIDRQ